MGGLIVVTSLAGLRLTSDQIVFFGLPCCTQGMQDIFISPLYISTINLSPLYFIQAILNIRYALIDCSVLKCLGWGVLQEKCDDFVMSCAETQDLFVLERMSWVVNCLRCTPRVVDISCNCWSYPFSDLLFFSGAWVWSRPWRKTMRWTWSTSQSASFLWPSPVCRRAELQR